MTTREVAFAVLAAATLLPGTTPPVGLGAGVAFALLLGNPWPAQAFTVSRHLLKTCVVGLGFGLSLDAVWTAGAQGVGYTVAGIVVTLGLGIALGKLLGVAADCSLLVTAGTSICGASAIAAVGPAIGARPEAMTVSLTTVFLLNAVALYLFPVVGRALDLGQAQFGVWAAISIHDTSSVVGAASAYGPQALELATVLKLARAVWIVPIALVAGAWARRAGRAARGGVDVPWFIGLFLLAAAVRSALPGQAPALDALAGGARQLLVLTLFLVGSGMSRDMLRAVGGRPLAQGLLLWLATGSASLWATWQFVPG